MYGHSSRGSTRIRTAVSMRPSPGFGLPDVPTTPQEAPLR